MNRQGALVVVSRSLAVFVFFINQHLQCTNGDCTDAHRWMIPTRHALGALLTEQGGQAWLEEAKVRAYHCHLRRLSFERWSSSCFKFHRCLLVTFVLWLCLPIGHLRGRFVRIPRQSLVLGRPTEMCVEVERLDERFRLVLTLRRLPPPLRCHL